MFWTAVASSTVASAASERSTALASAAPSYQQKHIKPLRPMSNNWQLSNAAFKALQPKQKQQRIQEQIQQVTHEEQLQFPKQNKNCNKRVTPKRESKIFKVFTSCKCAQG
ncbi:hypothetical protein ACLKA7_009027 [Drosophila subpalustris]